MTKQMMVYERAVPLSVAAHKETSVLAGKSFGFASDVNSVPLLAPEFGAAAIEHTIVFAGPDETLLPAVILGTKVGHNDHLDGEGNWLGNYVPAFLRRYPFVFAQAADQESFTLCIDEDFEGVNSDGKGERLFDTDGNRTEYLERMLKFTSDYQTQYIRTQTFTKRLLEYDLLEPAQARFNVGEGETTALSGFRTIKRDAMRNLPAEALSLMAKNDELELCYVHLQSLNNLPVMTRRLEDRTKATAAA